MFNKELILTLEEVEKLHIQLVLNMCNNNKTLTAKNLGICTKTLYNLIYKHGLAKKTKSREKYAL